jgi:hypothetical protein
MKASYFHYAFNFTHLIQRQYKLLYTTVFQTHIYLISRCGLDDSAFVPLSGQEIFSSHPTRTSLVLPRPVQWTRGSLPGIRGYGLKLTTHTPARGGFTVKLMNLKLQGSFQSPGRAFISNLVFVILYSGPQNCISVRPYNT